MQNILIVGGTSGLGLCLASLFQLDGHMVYITGRKKPKNHDLHYIECHLDCNDLEFQIMNLVEQLPHIDCLVYAAGYNQTSRIANLSDQQILEMTRVGLLAPMLLLAQLLRKQEKLSNFIAITSTSQWNPREFEPVYAATKAGLGMFANSVSLDSAVGKVLVVGTAGMKTSFWRNDNRDTAHMLDPWLVAGAVKTCLGGDFSYKFIKVLYDPLEVRVAERRQ